MPAKLSLVPVQSWAAPATKCSNPFSMLLLEVLFSLDG